MSHQVLSSSCSDPLRILEVTCGHSLCRSLLRQPRSLNREAVPYRAAIRLANGALGGLSLWKG
eukprot:gene4629-biopygen12708